MKKFIKCFDGALAFVMAALFSFMSIGTFVLPSHINSLSDEEITFNAIFSVKTNEDGYKRDVSLNSAKSTNPTTQIKMFGVIPVKEASVVQGKRRYVIPSGESFGIKLYTDGVIVVGVSSVDGENGTQNPATEVGIKVGDIIEEVDGQKVNTTDEMQDKIANCNGKALSIILKRGDKYINTVLCPVLSKESGTYKAGMWVRDSTAGVGTVTFYNTDNGTFAGLGHPLNDVDTNEMMPLLSGEAVRAKVINVYKGLKGETGSLNCTFTDEAVGTLVTNNTNGIYGKYTCQLPVGDKLPVATCQEVQRGEAQILSTVDGEKPKYYNILIERINYNNDGTKKNMVIKVTDKRLLEVAGGIVQGMSGSPIIQNGMVVGAVTHVLVNNPEKGYAIFAENMVETADGLQ